VTQMLVGRPRGTVEGESELAGLASPVSRAKQHTARAPSNRAGSAYKALGTPVYSSAVFNFIPKTAMAFYHAVAKDDMATQHRLLKQFFMPYLAIRNKGQGYAVSIVKAGAKLVGHDAGPVRAPLTDLKPAEMEELDALIKALGPQ